MRGYGGQIIAAAIVVGFIGFAQGDLVVSRIAELAALALILVVISALVYRHTATGDIVVTRQVPSTIIPWGDRLSQSLTILNTSRIRIPMLEVSDDATLPGHPHGFVTSLAAQKDITWSFHIDCQQRGRWRLGPVTAQMSDPLGVFPVTRQVGTQSSVLVLPRWVTLNRTAFKIDGFLLGEVRGRQRGEMPPTVNSIREYSPGDPLASIDWRSSARLGNLMCRLYEPDVQTVLHLLVDLDGPILPDAEEMLITAAASIGIYALQKAGLRVGLLASGEYPLQLAPNRGRGTEQRFLELLAEARSGDASKLTQQIERLDRQVGVGQTIVLLSSRPAAAWTTWLGRWQQRGIATRVIAVTDRPTEAWGVPALYLSPSLNVIDASAELVATLEGSSSAARSA